jgi:hypothetical protein
MMPSQALEATLLARFCQPQAALGCVAGPDGGRGPHRARNRGRALCTKVHMSGSNLHGWEGICTTR